MVLLWDRCVQAAFLICVWFFAMNSAGSSEAKVEKLSCSEHGMGKETQKDKKGKNDKKDEKNKKDKKHEKDTPGKPIKKEDKDKLAAKHGAAVARTSAVAKPNKTTSAKDESYSYYTDESEDLLNSGDEQSKAKRERDKDRAKYRGADKGIGSDESGYSYESPSKPAIKNKDKSTLKKGAAPKKGRNPSRGRSRSRGRKSNDKRPAAKSRQGAAVAHKSEAVAHSPAAMSAKGAQSHRHSQAKPSPGDDAVGKETQFFRLRPNETMQEALQRPENKKRKSDTINFTCNIWVLDNDCSPEQIEEFVYGPNAMYPHCHLIFVDSTPEDTDSVAFTKLLEMADKTTSCSGDASCSGKDRKAVFRLGEKQDTHAFVILHRHCIKSGRYQEQMPKGADWYSLPSALLRYGTLTLKLNTDTQACRLLKIGIVNCRRSEDCQTARLERREAITLAKWTQDEQHEFVVTHNSDYVSSDVWQKFGEAGNAKWTSPISQPFRADLSPIKVQHSDGHRPTEHAAVFPCYVFVFAPYDSVRMPSAEKVTACPLDSRGRLADSVMNLKELPIWHEIEPVEDNVRQNLAAITLKAIQWDKGVPEGCMPMHIWFGEPKREEPGCIIHTPRPASKSKGKGKGKGKDKGKDKGKGKHDGKGKGKGKGKKDRSAVASSAQLSRAPPSRTSRLPSHAESSVPRQPPPSRSPSQVAAAPWERPHHRDEEEECDVQDRRPASTTKRPMPPPTPPPRATSAPWLEAQKRKASGDRVLGTPPGADADHADSSRRKRVSFDAAASCRGTHDTVQKSKTAPWKMDRVRKGRSPVRAFSPAHRSGSTSPARVVYPVLKKTSSGKGRGAQMYIPGRTHLATMHDEDSEEFDECVPDTRRRPSRPSAIVNHARNVNLW